VIFLYENHYQIKFSRDYPNYPHEGLVVPKVNAMIGGSIPHHEVPTWHDGKLPSGGKIPHVCQKIKIKKKLKKLKNKPFILLTKNLIF